MEKFKKLSLIGNIIFAVLILVADILFMYTDINIYIIKTLASALFVLCGAFNLTLAFVGNGENRLKSIVMLIGIIFAFIGDVVLIRHFILGAIFFAIGHVFYLIYFIMLCKPKWVDLIVFVVIFGISASLILFLPAFEFGDLKFLILIYALIICLMLAKAIGNYIVERNFANLIIMLGALLFYTSDLMLVFANFSSIAPRLFDQLCLWTYYPAQFLLAFSIYLKNLLSLSGKEN